MEVLSGFGKLFEIEQEVFHERHTDHYPINPGNSGEPPVDSDDRIVGINSTVLMGAQSITFSIPVDIVPLVRRLLIFDVEERNPADAIGLRAGKLNVTIEDESWVLECAMRSHDPTRESRTGTRRTTWRNPLDLRQR
jgi:hypothetical protein